LQKNESTKDQKTQRPAPDPEQKGPDASSKRLHDILKEAYDDSDEIKQWHVLPKDPAEIAARFRNAVF